MGLYEDVKAEADRLRRIATTIEQEFNGDVAQRMMAELAETAGFFSRHAPPPDTPLPRSEPYDPTASEKVTSSPPD